VCVCNDGPRKGMTGSRSRIIRRRLRDIAVVKTNVSKPVRPIVPGPRVRTLHAVYIIVVAAGWRRGRRPSDEDLGNGMRRRPLPSPRTTVDIRERLNNCDTHQARRRRVCTGAMEKHRVSREIIKHYEICHHYVRSSNKHAAAAKPERLRFRRKAKSIGSVHGRHRR